MRVELPALADPSDAVWPLSWQDVTAGISGRAVR